MRRRRSAWRGACRPILVGALLPLASSCFLEDLFGPNAHAISGVVTSDGVAVVGATVRITGDASVIATTGPDGRFVVRGLERGTYFLRLDPGEGTTLPVGIWTFLDDRDLTGLDLEVLPPGPHSITGSVSGASGMMIAGMLGTNHGFVPLEDDGTFAFEGLRLGHYDFFVGAPGAPVFSPGSVTAHGEIDFAHKESGNGTLGDVTLTSVLHGANDVSDLFVIPSSPPDGVGTLRPVHPDDVPDGRWEAYIDVLFNAAGTVVVTFASDLGSSSITIVIGRRGTFTATSSSFDLTERLVNSTGITFTAVSPP